MLIALVPDSAHILLYRATDTALCGELFANSSVLVKRTANLLRHATNSSVLCTLPLCQYQSEMREGVNGKGGLTCELLADGAVSIKSLGFIMADIGVGWCLDSSGHATGAVLLDGVFLRHGGGLWIWFV